LPNPSAKIVSVCNNRMRSFRSTTYRLPFASSPNDEVLPALRPVDVTVALPPSQLAPPGTARIADGAAAAVAEDDVRLMHLRSEGFCCARHNAIAAQRGNGDSAYACAFDCLQIPR